MTATSIISHYNHLNGNDISGKRLREFHNEIQMWLDKNGSGPHTKMISAIRQRIAKAIKNVKPDEVAEVRVRLIDNSKLTIDKPVKKVAKKKTAKPNPKFFVRASAEAEKAATFIIGNTKLVPEEVISTSKSDIKAHKQAAGRGKAKPRKNIRKVTRKQALTAKKEIKNHKSQITNPKSLSGVNYDYKEIDLGPYKNDFHRMFSDTIVQIHGLPGHGKTVWVLKFAQDRAQRGNNVLYVAREEFGRSVFDMKLKEHNINHHNIRFRKTLQQEDIDWANIIFLDSVDALNIDHKKMEEMSSGLNKVWILIKQSTKDGDFRGSQEWEHLVDIAGEIRNRKLILHKNRLDPHNSVKREKLITDDAIHEAKKKAEIRKAVKEKMQPKPEPQQTQPVPGAQQQLIL